MNNFEMTNNTSYLIDFKKDLLVLINGMIDQLDINNGFFEIIFVDANVIKKINREYRGKDKVTDVISFALEDGESEHINPHIRVLGDIYISLEVAKKQAESYGHSFKREVAFLIVHGFLHLLGYTHENKEDEKVMFLLQERILDEYGFKK